MALAKIYRNRYDDTPTNRGRVIASVTAILFHSILFFIAYKTGFSGEIPEPAPKGIEIIFETELPKPKGVPRRNPQQKPVPNPPIVNNPGNTAPQSAVVAQQNQSTKPTPQPEAKESELTDKGDIDKPAPEPTINNRALFTSTSKGEADANNPNDISENSLYQGVGRDDVATRSSNTPIGPDHRQPITFNLSGRSVVGSLPLPVYNSQNQGRVVVEITVDQNGNVTKAVATGKGSTVQDATLWRAAEDAAKKAKFNVKKDAPIFQTGTITYVFSLT